MDDYEKHFNAQKALDIIVLAKQLAYENDIRISDALMAIHIGSMHQLEESFGNINSNISSGESQMAIVANLQEVVLNLDQISSSLIDVVGALEGEE